MPSQRIRSGSSAIFGMGKVAAMSGWPTASAREKKPVKTPTATPAAAPAAKPSTSRRRLAPTCTKSWPEAAISPSSRSTPTGDGRKSAGIQPTRVSASQRTRSPASAATRSSRCSGRRRKAARSRTVTRDGPLTPAPLDERRLGLRLDQPPDALGGVDEGGLAHLPLVPGPLQLDRHDVETRPGRRESTTTRSAMYTASWMLWVT